MKVVINTCYGGFGLSDEVYDRYKELSGKDISRYREISREDPLLIQIIEDLGSEKSSSDYAELRIVEIPDDVEWVVEEYDGWEWVAEKHRIWG